MNRIPSFYIFSTFLFSFLSCYFLFAETDSYKHLPYPLSVKNFPCKASAAYTYWEPYSEGLDIAYYTGSLVEEGDVIGPVLPCRSGFKLLIGGSISHRNIDVLLEYTWFYNPENAHAASLIPGAIYISIFDPTFTLDAITSNYTNQFNKVCTSAEVNIFHSKTAIIELLGGCTGAWDFQKLTASAGSAEVENTSLESYFSQNWYGVGPYIGLCPILSIVDHLELFLLAGTSLLLSKHEFKQRQYIWDSNDQVETPSINYKSTLFSVDPMFDINLGVRSDWMLSNWSIAFEISWQVQTYFNHNVFLDSDSTGGNIGLYSMQGLTANFMMDF